MSAFNPADAVMIAEAELAAASAFLAPVLQRGKSSMPPLQTHN